MSSPMLRSYWVSPLLLLTVVGMIAGCAAPVTKVGVNVLEPAKSSEATRIRRVAVMQFEAKDRVDVTGDIETMLAGILVDERRYFEVVERRQLNALLGELRLGERGLLENSTVSQVGKMLGANGVYLGKVTSASWSDQRSNERRSVCSQREIKRDKKGKSYDAGCARWRETSASCTTRIATFEFLPKLVSIETGTIVYSRAHSGEVTSKSCREPDTGASAPITSGEQLLLNAKMVAMDSFRRDVAPMATARTLDVLGPGERIGAPQMRERFNNASAFAKEGRLDRACEMWRDVAVSEQNSPELFYNLGVCAEVTGDLESASNFYARADRLLTQPNKSISAALVRVQADQASRAKLRTQLQR
ncbi:CsgG/HfaB family protein [Hydrogenophaga sp.]|uniref:CsgG/HfaB family protein n=1 Tax=Hydrogenophaga sp. TaxID=1904254 RepID=UPI0025C0C128|nr:CsgG/HfaB family protein [Hydrogenophaga sp.]MBT9465526.1 hypothetical protein [Hydrogenophaga sp.]